MQKRESLRAALERESLTRRRRAEKCPVCYVRRVTISLAALALAVDVASTARSVESADPGVMPAAVGASVVAGPWVAAGSWVAGSEVAVSQVSVWSWGWSLLKKHRTRNATTSVMCNVAVQWVPIS